MHITDKILDEITTGDLSWAQIAEKYNVSMDLIEVVFEEYMDNLAVYYGEDESMDGDFDSAMASAGFGTDEDYGYFGDEF